ncbi:hypothetical protein [Bradyrhizobium roseum]|nr:hypothetical protein [Bradyrhizobium roseus]WKA26375.1 hypothetical protein QUH67_22560 [Bradyrhizobium roseus]
MDKALRGVLLYFESGNKVLIERATNFHDSQAIKDVRAALTDNGGQGL